MLCSYLHPSPRSSAIALQRLMLSTVKLGYARFRTEHAQILHTLRVGNYEDIGRQIIRPAADKWSWEEKIPMQYQFWCSCLIFGCKQNDTSKWFNTTKWESTKCDNHFPELGFISYCVQLNLRITRLKSILLVSWKREGWVGSIQCHWISQYLFVDIEIIDRCQ